MLAGALVKINYSYADPESQYQYYTGSIIFYGGSLIAEAAILPTCVKIITPTLLNSYWTTFVFINTADKFGRMMGNISFTVYSYFDSAKGKAAQPFYAYIVNSAVLTTLIIVNLLLNRRLTKHMEIDVIVD